MRVLVYGVGVISSLTVHALCEAENEVTVIARGKWREVLEKQGLDTGRGRGLCAAAVAGI